jgi:hypothetical protein
METLRANTDAHTWPRLSATSLLQRWRLDIKKTHSAFVGNLNLPKSLLLVLLEPRQMGGTWYRK